mmetsp:Transcript_65872/g.147070  ORF Transcript_65872/g.147070 Transcript_65872/m.147070 type:complete len:89 (+) Transcript_65872:1-267(+)
MHMHMHMHQVIASSLLMVYDADAEADDVEEQRPGLFMIDFAKTTHLEDISSSGTRPHRLTHRADWKLGNLEDGYLTGLDSLIALWGDL